MKKKPRKKKSNPHPGWAESIERLGGEISVVVGDVLISSSFISYAGPFSKSLREWLIKSQFLEWMIKKKIPMSEGISPIDFLADDAVRASWNTDGLPSDPVSIENGTILSNSERYPLLIDPQLQGIT